MKTMALVGWTALMMGCASTTPLSEQPSPEKHEPAAEPAPAEPEVGAAEPEPDKPELGAEEAAEPAPVDPQPTGPAGVPDANLTVGSLSADGLTLKDVSCRADGLGLLGSLVIASSLSKKKAALTACAKGQSPRVGWVFLADKITSVTVEQADAKATACLQKALKGAAAPGEGECLATLEL